MLQNVEALKLNNTVHLQQIRDHRTFYEFVASLKDILLTFYIKAL